MIHFAKEVYERNITINRVAAKTTVKINKEGIGVKGICSEYCEDCYVEEVFRPLRMILDKPFVYALSVGEEIVAFGMHSQ